MVRLALALLCLVTAAPAAADPFDFELIADESSDFLDLEIAADGTLHIAYETKARFDVLYSLRHAEKAGATWQITTIATDVTGEEIDLELDSTGEPRIMYRGENELRLARRAGGVWSDEQVDHAGGRFSIAIDSLDRTHATWSNALGRHYGIRGDSIWQIRPVDIRRAYSAVLLLDDQDIAHLFYNDRDATTIGYATNVTGPWTYEAASGPGVLGDRVEATLGPDGSFHVVSTGGTSYYARGTQGAWADERIDDFQSGRAPIAVNSEGNPFIARFGTELTTRVNGYWFNLNLQRSATANGSIVLENGRPVVAISDAQDLQLARLVSVTPPPPTITSFQAADSEIFEGQSTVLTWRAGNTERVYIEPLAYTSEYFGASTSVSPLTTTEYTLTAVGLGGTASASTTVTVTPWEAPPLVHSFASVRTEVTYPNPARLTWTTEFADEVVIFPPGDVVDPNPNRSQAFFPDLSTTYEIRASNPFGTTSRELTITVIPRLPVIDSFIASESVVHPGGSVTLTWETELASSGVVLHPIGPVEATGETTIQVAESTEFRLGAVNPHGSTTQTVSVAVMEIDPIIDTFTVAPTSIAEGQSAVATWETRFADTVVLEPLGEVESSGVRSLTPLETTTFTLRASNSVGMVEQSMTVEVDPTDSVPNIQLFAWDHVDLLPDSQPTVLRWQVENANTVEITDLGFVGATGALAYAPTETRTFSLLATNSAGSSAASATVYVRPFRLEQFGVAPDQVGRSETATLNWHVVGSADVTIDGIGSVALSGSMEVGPDESTEYRITATNGADPMESSTALEVGDFEYGALRFSWSQDEYPGTAPAVVGAQLFTVYVLGEDIDRFVGIDFGIDLPEGVILVESELLGSGDRNFGAGEDFLVQTTPCRGVANLTPLVELTLFPTSAASLEDAVLTFTDPVGGTAPGISLHTCDDTTLPLAAGSPLELEGESTVTVAEIALLAERQGTDVYLRWDLPGRVNRVVLLRSDLTVPLLDVDQARREYRDRNAPAEVEYQLHAWEGDVYRGQGEVKASNAPQLRANQLHPLRPNPFNPSTEIAFDLEQAARVSLEVHDASGRRVRTLLQQSMPAGTHTVTWDGRTDDGVPVASGVYFVRWITPNDLQTRRATLVK